MVAEEAPTTREDKSPLMGLHAGPSRPMHSPTRRNTTSTISSDKYAPIPAGCWSFTLHGNCPRCHHHHNSTIIRCNISDDPIEASHILCEHCKQRWLTIGGKNITQISLLSTKTTEPDCEETDFRYTLINIVRAASAIASPIALASVPEAVSRQPSWGSLQRSIPHTFQGSTVRSNANPTTTQETNKSSTSSIGQTNTNAFTMHHQGTQHLKPGSAKTILNNLKNKLRSAFPVLKKAHLRNFLRSSGRSKTTTKAEGKRPIMPSPEKEDTTTERNIHNIHQEQDAEIYKNVENVPSTAGVCKTIDDLRDFDPEVIRQMTSHEQHNWIRDQITHFQCRRTSHCSSHRSSSSFMVDSSTQVHFLPLASEDAPRRHSLEGLGSHFDHFLSGPPFPRTGSLTISATRTSEADTAIDTPNIVANSPYSGLDMVQRPRHQSWSPRPTSLANPRYSWQHLRHERTARDSMDSIISRDLARSRFDRRGTDRLSIGSLTHMTFPSSPNNMRNTDSVRSSQELDMTGGLRRSA